MTLTAERGFQLREELKTHRKLSNCISANDSSSHYLPVHRHIRRLTTRFNSPMPIIDKAHANMLTARAIHANQVSQGTARHEVLDWSAMIAGARVAAGLDGLDSGKHGRVVKED